MRGGSGLLTPKMSDLLPWYYPENQHCSCDHASLHPTEESRVSKEWKKPEPSHISEKERHKVESKEGEHRCVLSHLCPKGP